jgi:hypothetical protein
MAIPTTGLITYLDFQNPACFTNGGTAVNDLSPANNDFVFRNNTTPAALYSYDPTFGTITLAPGLGNLAAVNQSFMNGTGTFTISFWFYVNSGGIPDQYIFYIGGFPSNFISIDTRGNSYIRISGSGLPTYVDSGAGSLDLNTYNSVTVTYDGGTINLYVNNVFETTSSASFNLNGGSGSYPGFLFNLQATGTGVNGLALFSIYNTVLTTLERGDLYQVGYDRFFGPPPPTPTSEYSPFDIASYPGSGSTWFDLTANNNDLTLTNATFATTPIKSFTFANGNAYKSSPVNFPTNNFTFDIWLKFNGGTEQVIYAAGHDGNGNCALLGYRFPSVNSYKPFWEMGGGVARLNMTLDPTVDTWYNYVFTGDGTTVKGYVNGVLDVSTSQSYGSIASSYYGSILGNFITGLGAPSSSFPSITTYGQYAIYNTALDSTEILNNYNTNLPNYSPTPPPYVGSVGGRIFGEGLNG